MLSLPSLFSLSLFTQISLLLVVATLVSLIMRLLKQPVIIGHLVTGLLLGPVVLRAVDSTETLQLFSEIGIAFLLFSVGLNLNPRVFKEYGKIAIVTGVGQVVLTSVVGVGVALALGFGLIPSLYIAVALAFSSTIIILKLLSDKGDLEKLYAKISIGFLLVQDLLAILLLFILPFITDAGSSSGLVIVQTVALGVLAGCAAYAFASIVITRLHPYLSRSQELLFLFANAWGMGIAALFAAIGFSLESGALVAGIALSTLPSRHEINARLTPLRDFFIIAFFVLLGSHLTLSALMALLVPVIVLSILVLVGNPLILMGIMGYLGYRTHTSLETGLTVAQVSEFSLILVALGVTLGHITNDVLSLVTIVAVVTIFGSTYLILYSNRIARALSPYLGMFERRRITEHAIEYQPYPVVLFGGSRVGFDFVQSFKKGKQRFLVVDYDPEVVSQLTRDGLAVDYGDASNIDYLDELKLHEAELVVSTIPDLETNLLITEYAKRSEQAPMVLAVAHNIANALELYRVGVDYVILPHFLGGRAAAEMTKKFVRDAEELVAIRTKHLAHLRERIAHRHEYPELERYR